MLEVGFGPGTDFIQWLRAGAVVSGIDLTPEGLANLRHRIAIYQLPEPERLEVADAEALPFGAESFDLGYSFGVLHHTPDTEKALRELVRVVRAGGEIKVMLYNRHSIRVFKTWAQFALLRGKPFKGLGWAIWHNMESLGTKAYTRKELKSMLGGLPLTNVRVHPWVTSADYFAFSALKPVNWLIRLVLTLAGDRPAWRLADYRFDEVPAIVGGLAAEPQMQFTGNRLGFYHCISATKV